jgi:hypothetical protein
MNKSLNPPDAQPNIKDEFKKLTNTMAYHSYDRLVVTPSSIRKISLMFVIKVPDLRE